MTSNDNWTPPDGPWIPRRSWTSAPWFVAAAVFGWPASIIMMLSTEPVDAFLGVCVLLGGIFAAVGLVLFAKNADVRTRLAVLAFHKEHPDVKPAPTPSAQPTAAGDPPHSMAWTREQIRELHRSASAFLDDFYDDDDTPRPPDTRAEH